MRKADKPKKPNILATAGLRCGNCPRSLGVETVRIGERDLRLARCSAGEEGTKDIRQLPFALARNCPGKDNPINFAEGDLGAPPDS